MQFAECEQRLDETVRTPISAKQFLDLTAKARRTFELTESQWKRVDKLEEYVQARAHYRISNKLWQKMECYASVFLALGGEKDQALDNVMTSKMLLTVLSLIANNRKEDDELFVHVLENIFGDDKINACRMLAEASGVDMSDVTRKEELEKAAQRRAQRLEELAQIKAEKELAMKLALEAAAAEAAEAEAVEETAENVATEATETTEATEEAAPVEEKTEETAEVAVAQENSAEGENE